MRRTSSSMQVSFHVKHNFGAVFPNYGNTINEDLENEEIVSFEAGYGYSIEQPTHQRERLLYYTGVTVSKQFL